MAVFKYLDGRYTEHHFALDPATGAITIWEQWLREGEKLFEGSYRQETDGVRLSGELLPAGERVTLDLRPRDVGPRGYRAVAVAAAEGQSR